MEKYIITSKGNGFNFYAWMGKKALECIKLGGRFYIAKLKGKELIPQGNPLKKSEFILAK